VTWSPKVDVMQRGNDLVLRADLPGVKPEDVYVEVTDDAIVMSGQRKEEHVEERGNVYRVERTHGDFFREIPLPESAIVDQAKASFTDGVLEVTVPAPSDQAARGGRLEIKSSKTWREKLRLRDGSTAAAASTPGGCQPLTRVRHLPWIVPGVLSMDLSTFLIIRGLVGIALGVLAMFWPGITLVILVGIFGLYASLDGLANLLLGFRSSRGRSWPQIVQGLVGIAAGVLTFIWPTVTALLLVLFIGAWAIVAGVLEVTAAVRLRKVIKGEWLLALSGLMSMLLGALVFAFPAGGAVGIAWRLGIYAAAAGVVLVTLALRIRTHQAIPLMERMWVVLPGRRLGSRQWTTAFRSASREIAAVMWPYLTFAVLFVLYTVRDGIIGPYSVLIGWALMVLGVRRHVALEMVKA
jgi:uncharacterized membrane protein HdeD (DUF308 family)/HSP20 family molecular chaperone IbpA